MIPLRTCLLSGGESQRMGRDKALLPHPEGGSWLERTLVLLAQMGSPISLLSRHPQHLELAEGLNSRLSRPASPHRGPLITALAEPPPWEGPLLALHRLMQRYPDQRLLLCPVDMPHLSLTTLHSLLAAAETDARDQAGLTDPPKLHLAHDGARLQPLLGVYPSSAEIRNQLAAAVNRGERGLQRWLAALPCPTVFCQSVPLDPRAIRNINRPGTVAGVDAAGWRSGDRQTDLT